MDGPEDGAGGAGVAGVAGSGWVRAPSKIIAVAGPVRPGRPLVSYRPHVDLLATHFADVVDRHRHGGRRAARGPGAPAGGRAAAGDDGVRPDDPLDHRAVDLRNPGG